jgi:hypothetical protein
LAAPWTGRGGKKLQIAGHGEAVTVLSGNELEIQGVRCRLLGIRLLADEKVSLDAKRFLTRYMEHFGGYFSIWNDHDPVNDIDGVPLIWLFGHSNEGFAQEGLVKVGLASVDFAQLTDYQFRVLGKDGDRHVFDWKQCLSDAEADWNVGKKASFRFGWPVPDSATGDKDE